MKFFVNKWTLIKNSANQIMVILLDDTGVPYNISGLTSLSCKIKKSDNTYLTLAQSNGLAFGNVNTCWLYVFDLTSDQITDIGVGVHDVGIEIVKGAENVLLYYKDSLTIQEPVMAIF